MPRGGKREGKPGKAYPQRSDLHRAEFTGQAYGQAAQQKAAQQAVPIQAAPAAAPAVGGPLPGPEQIAGMQGGKPGSMGDLFAPTGRPDEPVTHGIDSGPGAGSEVMRTAQGANPDLDRLRAVYAIAPTESLRDIIEYMEQQQ